MHASSVISKTAAEAAATETRNTPTSTGVDLSKVLGETNQNIVWVKGGNN